MSISLQKGQKISLSKDNEGLSKIIIGLGWDKTVGKKTGLFSIPKQIDCDAAAIMLDNGKLKSKNDIIYFGNLKHSSKSVNHMGDNLTGAGDGDDEQIIIELPKVPQNYDRIIIVVNIYHAVNRKQHFGMINNSFIRVVDARNNNEFCRYNLTDNYSDMTSMIFGEVYNNNNNNQWKFNAIGQGTTDIGLSELSKRYV